MPPEDAQAKLVLAVAEDRRRIETAVRALRRKLVPSRLFVQEAVGAIEATAERSSPKSSFATAAILAAIAAFGVFLVFTRWRKSEAVRGSAARREHTGAAWPP